MKLLRKKEKIYLSDKRPLSITGKILLVITYIILISWAIAILWPLFQMVLSAFNGKQEQYLMLNDQFTFSLKHFEYLFNNTLFLQWTKNTILIALATAVLTLLIVSLTGY